MKALSNHLNVGYRQSFALLFEDSEHFQGPGGSRPRIFLKSLMLKQQRQKTNLLAEMEKVIKKMQYNTNVYML